MERDTLFPKSRCFSAVLKKDMRDINTSFFKLAKDEECTEALYETNYIKEIDKVMKQVATRYVEDVRKINFSLPSVISESEQYYFNM